jgi:hypothetical protein
VGQAKRRLFTGIVRVFQSIDRLVQDFNDKHISDNGMHTRQPKWPVEHRMLTSGTLDALLISRRNGDRVVGTPHLDITGQTNWR